ncbi:premnaspirodiene oxygenase-like [Coffea eugenioides]|uniref:premnaspirodiene oxygenase-like n=1 Tax=Coffea eugenioides TaxID=49369 RepID=UPI000F610FF2|nr:premnaspirodiene oxygenase-like [Coffea eugenioides]
MEHLSFTLNLITFFFFATILLTLIKERKRSHTIQKLPPGPWKLPFIGCMHHLIGSLPHRRLKNLAQKHGPLIHLQLGEVSAAVVSSPNLAKEIMKTRDLSFASRPELLTFKIVCYDSKDILFSPYGDYWRQMRKICVTELLSAKSVRSFHNIRQDEVLHLVEAIRQLAGKSVNITEKLFSHTSSMVCRAAFGQVSKEDQYEFVRLMKQVAALGGGFDIADLFPSYKILHVLTGLKPKLQKIHHKMDIIFENLIKEHVKNQTRKKKFIADSNQEDLIDVLLRIRDSEALQFPITNDNIKAIIFDMFAGGTETSSSTVEWAMSEMIRNPMVMAKAQEEIRQAFKVKPKIDEIDVQELRYLKFVIKETLRLHPPAPLLIPRECREQCEVNGYTIPIKTKVVVNCWALGRDPEYWSDPESFEPERFDNNPVDFTGNHFEFVPFGGGRRICPGMSFGLVNMELQLALLLYHFNWRLPDGMNSEDLDMIENNGITATRKNNLYLVPSLYDPSIDL